MTIAATQGVEGFCGWGVQINSFASGIAGALPQDTAPREAPAINPMGLAWLRRGNDQNIKSHPNFVDLVKPLPRNDGCDELVDASCPADWPNSVPQRRSSTPMPQHGPAGLQQAMTGGE